MTEENSRPRQSQQIEYASSFLWKCLSTKWSTTWSVIVLQQQKCDFSFRNLAADSDVAQRSDGIAKGHKITFHTRDCFVYIHLKK